MVLWLLGALQIILGARVVLRLIRSVGGVRIEAATAPRSERVSIILPVLNETARIKACLDGLMAQSGAVAEILVVDGGSSDGTQSIVEDYGSRDRRVRLIDASPFPATGPEKHGAYTWGWKTPIHGHTGFSLSMRMYAARLCWHLPCWPMPNEPEFQLSRLRPTNNFRVWGGPLHP